MTPRGANKEQTILQLKRRDFLKGIGVVGGGVLVSGNVWVLNRLAPLGDTLHEDYPYRGWEDLYRERAARHGVLLKNARNERIMSVTYVNLGDIQRRSDNGRPDCGLGHACQFCPHEPHCTLDKPRHEKLLIEGRLERIDQIVMVMANKGGVGKSTVSVGQSHGRAGRARLSRRRGRRRRTRPHQSRFFGFAGAHVRLSEQGPATCDFAADAIAHPIKVGSLAFLMESDDTPIVWRDAYKHYFVHHLLGSFDRG